MDAPPLWSTFTTTLTMTAVDLSSDCISDFDASPEARKTV